MLFATKVVDISMELIYISKMQANHLVHWDTQDIIYVANADHTECVSCS